MYVFKYTVHNNEMIRIPILAMIAVKWKTIVLFTVLSV